MWRQRWEIKRAWRLARKAAWGKASPARKRKKTSGKVKPFPDSDDDHDGAAMGLDDFDDEDDEYPTRPSTADGDHGPSLAERLELGTPRDILRLAFAHSRAGSISPLSAIGRGTSHVDDHRNDHEHAQRLVRDLLYFSGSRGAGSDDDDEEEEEEEERPTRPGRGRSLGRVRPAELVPPPSFVADNNYYNKKNGRSRRSTLRK